ncbi:MAG: polysaccharide biosynthesis/export family protein [Ramlibacter sp.]|nr:polysaccharide biosynthesis/export family protein [Ramlibacter sp.]
MTLRSLLLRLGALGAVGVLAGCAYAPGMTLGENLEGAFRPNTKLGGAPAESAGWPDWLRWGNASAPVQTLPTAADGTTPPPGQLISITPSLVKQIRESRPKEISQDVKALFGTAKPYRIGAGDVLGITLWSHPELVFPQTTVISSVDPTGQNVAGTGFSVNFDGFIQFPYVGSVKVAGLTEQQAQQLLLDVAGKYLKNPQMTVRVIAYRNGRVYVDGEVRNPGVQAVNDVPLTLPDALARAGGLTANADRAAVAVTRDGKTTVVSLPQLAEMGVNPANILLTSGDLVRVLNRDDTKVYVLGEVTKPAPQLMRNGHLTLNEALGEAGGVSQVSGNPRQIYVIRNGATGNPEIYHLDAQTPVALAMADLFELKPRDVVFVDPVPLVNWNRAISLLVPSGALLNTTVNTLK